MNGCISKFYIAGDCEKEQSTPSTLLTRSLKSLGRSVGRRNWKSIVNQVIKDSFMKKLVAARLGEFLCKELIETCLPIRNSIFRDKRLSAIERFNWSEVAASLKQTAPILFTLLEKCVCSNHRSSHALKKEVNSSDLRNPTEDLK